MGEKRLAAIDVTKLANATTEAEADEAADEFNEQLKASRRGGGGTVSTVGVGAKSRKRVFLLDEMRGICVLCMVCYHAFNVLAFQFGVAWASRLYEFFQPAQPAFAALFILISGICSRLSRDVRKRGFLLAVVAMVISFVTVLLLPYLGFQDTQVWFGVLHLLAVSMLLFGFGKAIFDKIPAMLGVLLCLALFIVTAPVSQGYLGLFGFHVNLPEALYQNNALAFLGFFNHETFFSWDYFPLLPYFFLFLFGSYMGKFAEKERFPDFCYQTHLLFFGFLGRHALPIYLLHIPVFYGAAYFVQALIGMGISG